ncbi:MAG: septum formation initiator family protein [Patescibacteria group bacterium]
MIKKRKRGNIFLRIIYNQKFLAILGLVIIVLISIPLAKNISKRYNVNKEIKELEDEIVGLETNNKDLKRLVTYLESDQFVEEQARLNLGLKKPGEEVAVIKDNSLNLITGGQEAKNKINNEANSKEGANSQRWLDYFFRK